MKPAPPVTRARIGGDPNQPGGPVASTWMRGLFVTLEGVDRSGKTTQARLLCAALGPETVCVREPGGTSVGERVRDLLKDPGLEPGPVAEALLFAAARAELVQAVIRPALEQGRTVISDRFLDSSLAYQGEARGLGREAVAQLNELAVAGVTPDLTLLLAVDPAAAAGRGGDLDRLESEGAALQERVARAYESLAAADPARWRRIDGSRGEAVVHREVLAAVEAARAGLAVPA